MATSVSDRVDRLTAEGLIGMVEAARLMGTFRNGKGTHPSTLIRWCLNGISLADGRLLKLESIRCSNRLLTSRPAVLRFLAAQQDENIVAAEPRQRRAVKELVGVG